MNYLLRLTAALLISGCAHRFPIIIPCDIINPNVALCTSTDSTKPSYDLPVSKMRFYTCFSPYDIAAIRSFVRTSIEEGSQIQVLQSILSD